jgi:hypothetical protein
MVKTMIQFFNKIKSMIVVNNKTYTGKIISIINGKVYIEGNKLEVDGK